ncbi:MAG: zinc dependent phospholipase C family protein, partial [Oscillospiraceae bacterium]
MPEAYCHIRTARKALMLAKITCENTVSYEMGANGPDPFFVYKLFSKHPPYDIAQFGSRLHHEKCGEYLLCLVMNANTPTKRSFAMGALTHNALDACMHPYVQYITSEKHSYSMKNGHGFYEMALDSELYFEDYGKRCVPQKDKAPTLITSQLAEVCELIQTALHEVFSYDAQIEAIADSFIAFGFYHRLFVSCFGIKKAIARVLELLFWHNYGYLTCRMTQRHLKRNIEDKWVNEFTGTEHSGGAEELILDAEEIGAAYIKAAEGYWNGHLNIEQLSTIIGDRDYSSGLTSTLAHV